jgi:hypothetical protein
MSDSNAGANARERRPTVKRRLLIMTLGVALAGALAFGGWQLAYAQGQAAGRAAVANARADFIQSRPGGAGASGAGGAAAIGKPGAGGQAPTAGTIEKIDGSTLTVATESGSITVTLGEQTRIVRQAAASVTDLKAGDRVVVTGPRESAALVQIQGQ